MNAKKKNALVLLPLFTSFITEGNKKRIEVKLINPSYFAIFGEGTFPFKLSKGLNLHIFYFLRVQIFAT